MIFYSLHAQVEAEAVSLAGERYYAVALHGKAHLVHGPAFDLLFGPEIEAKPEQVLEEIATPTPVPPPAPEVRREKRVSVKAKRGRRIGDVTPRSTAKPAPPAGEFKSPYLDRALQALQHGPLTHAELAGHVYPDLSSTDAGKKLHSVVAQLRDRGLIERREDPSAGDILKWYAV